MGKRLGQHFLSDPAILDRIVRSLDPHPDDHVIEIGPGKGTLTTRLAPVVGGVVAIERDVELAAALDDSAIEHCRVVSGDALNVDWRAELPPSVRRSSYKVAGNVHLERLLASVKSELAEAEMHVAVFYGVADAENGRLRYANAGHPHAFRVPQSGPPQRLDATVPPLGLGDVDKMLGGEVAWQHESDLLLLFSDGITEVRNAAGEPFGESRVIDVVRAASTQPAERIVAAVFAAVDSFNPTRSDDQTVVVLKA